MWEIKTDCHTQTALTWPLKGMLLYKTNCGNMAVTYAAWGNSSQTGSSDTEHQTQQQLYEKNKKNVILQSMSNANEKYVVWKRTMVIYSAYCQQIPWNYMNNDPSGKYCLCNKSLVCPLCQIAPSLSKSYWKHMDEPHHYTCLFITLNLANLDCNFLHESCMHSPLQ